MNDYDLMSTPGALIRRAQQLHAAIWAEEVGTLFTSAQFAVLTAARRNTDIDQTQLSRESSLDTSTVQAVVMRLVDKGMLVRHRSKVDRRRWLVQLTELGTETLDRVMPAVLKIPNLLLEGLEDDERQEFHRMLVKVVEYGETRPRQIGRPVEDVSEMVQSGTLKNA